MSKKITEKPWGTFEVLLGDEKCKVKKITVNPKSRLSYQSHKQRAELWVVIEGTGILTHDGEENEVGPASVVMIPRELKHRIENTHETDQLIFIETQLGTYFGEDDIIRYDDDYGRHRDNWNDVDDDLN